MMKAYTVLVFVVVFVACSDGVGPAGAIQIAPRSLADTIESPVPLEVRIKVDERTTSVPDGIVNVFGVNGRIHASAEPGGGPRFAYRLDAQGTLTVFVSMGREAGETFLYVVAGDNRDSIPVSVLPGRSVGVGFPSADTALPPGAVYSVQLREIDRLGNRRSEVVQPLSLESSNPEVATVDGTAATAVGVGATTLRATTHMGNATATVFVLPDAVLMVSPGPALVDGYGVVLADLGVLPEMSESDCPSWHPDGDHLLLAGLRVVRLDGGTSQIPVSETGLIAGCGAYSANGEWIFLEGRLSTEPENSSSIWRVGADGSELSRITTATTGERHMHPSPSPDGTQVAYASGRALVVHSIVSATTSTLALQDDIPVPRWSPAGDWIAYTYPDVGGLGLQIGRITIWVRRLRLIRPDGTQDHSRPTLANPGLSSGVEWSPDGEWLVGATFYNDRFVFVHPSTGEALLSPASTAQYQNPLWQP